MIVPNPDASDDTEPHLRWRDPRPWRAFRHAADGVVYVTRTQRNMGIHLCLLSGIVALAAFLHVEAGGLAALCLAGGLVLVAEMFNTAVEAVVDLVMPDFHPLAKRAKDVAAGGVLLAAIAAVAVGIVVFGWMTPQTRGGLPLPARMLWMVPAMLLLPLLGLLAVRLRRASSKFSHKGGAVHPWKSAPPSDAPQR